MCIHASYMCAYIRIPIYSRAAAAFDRQPLEVGSSWVMSRDRHPLQLPLHLTLELPQHLIGLSFLIGSLRGCLSKIYMTYWRDSFICVTCLIHMCDVTLQLPLHLIGSLLCIHIYIYVYIYIYAHTRSHTKKFIYILIYIYMRSFIYLCTYLYAQEYSYGWM